MNRERSVRALRHPAFALVCAAIFALGAFAFVHAGVAAQDRLAENDPVKITDQALDRSFNQGVAEREIQSALAAGDDDLAQSFLDLAADRGVAVDPALANAREGTRYLTGQHADPWILGLAGVGLAITAGTYISLGATAPTRIGLSLVKAARRTGRLNPVLAVRVAREAVKVEEAGGLAELVGNVGRVESKAGTQAALDSLQVAEDSSDMSRLGRLAAAKGSKTRAIVKLLGRAAIVLTAGAFDVAIWLFWVAFALFGFAASCKAAVERTTLRYVRWRKARRVKQAELKLFVVST
jgi:hypothetical protein